MGSDFYSYDQESRCKTSCTTIYKLGAKWRFEKNGRWMKLRKTKMVSTLELVSQHSLMMTIWSKKFFKFWHTRMPYLYSFVAVGGFYSCFPAKSLFWPPWYFQFSIFVFLRSHLGHDVVSTTFPFLIDHLVYATSRS